MKTAATAVLFAGALYNALLTLAGPLETDPYHVSNKFETFFESNNGSDRYTYPTDFTRGIIPKFLHSHNDYWRDVPFYSALSVGAVSIEADVWLYNGTLYVGHETSALTPARTFDSLYITPLLTALRGMNPSSPFVTSPTRNGLFDTDNAQTTYLWIDIKTDGPSTFRAATAALKPLRDAGYLTTYSKENGVHTGPITVIGTGNTPLNLVQGVSPRDYFFDAPLATLNKTNITANESVIASTDFNANVGAARNGSILGASRQALESQIAFAKSRGIGARYWDTPAWPVSARNRIWSQLWDAGATLINVDDLQAGAGFADSSEYW